MKWISRKKFHINSDVFTEIKISISSFPCAVGGADALFNGTRGAGQLSPESRILCKDFFFPFISSHKSRKSKTLNGVWL